MVKYSSFKLVNFFLNVFKMGKFYHNEKVAILFQCN